ncbi:MAG: AAA family ATPase [archaeon]
MVTVSGLHGSGKSTYSQWIAKEFGLRYVSAGELFRRIAGEKGMGLKEFSMVALQDPSIDQMVDERSKQEASKGNVVIDGQLAAWMARQYADLKIFFTAPADVRIDRMAKRDGVSYSAKEEETAMREKIQRERYQETYGIDINDLSIYDVVIDTNLLPIEGNINILKNIISDYLAERRGK